MSHPTGIDLGTTNSAIAQLHGVTPVVVKNNEGDETTPSAVYVDRRGRVLVGRAAAERAQIDPLNARAEFKALMGIPNTAVELPASGTALTPEQLSAEVLKSLLTDLEQRSGERPSSAVITVPAAFDLAASEATRRAAALAGLDHVVLLPEPSAAALACGFQMTDVDDRWLVFDLGGGTFDAAVVRLTDGEFRVEKHAGDNVLGGKLIDWCIVDEALLPVLADQVSGLGGGRPHRADLAWRVTIAKLKRAAEAAKLRLSRVESTEIFVDVTTPDGVPLTVEYELTRSTLERFARPVFDRAIALCRKALTEASLHPQDLSKVVLVGGPTSMPMLREQLLDPVAGLGVPLDHSHDPLTIVAQGAAIMAATLPATSPVQVSGGSAAPASPRADVISLQLDYPRVSPDPDPLVVGRCHAAQPLSSGLRIEFVSEEAKPPWRSGLLPVDDSGFFQAELLAERGRLNTFAIQLTDSSGRLLSVEPSNLEYVVGAVETDPPLAHSIGIGLEDNRVSWVLSQGASLPCGDQVTLRTSVALSPASPEISVRVPLVEGEYPRADRNRVIGCLEVTSNQVARLLPSAAEIDVRIEVDAHRVVSARAYIPALDLSVEKVMRLDGDELLSQNELAKQAGAEFHRLSEMRSLSTELGSELALTILRDLESSNREAELRHQIEVSVDADAAMIARQRVVDLRVALDGIEAALQVPLLIRSAHDAADEVASLRAGLPPDLANRYLVVIDELNSAASGFDRIRLEQAIRQAGLFVAEALERGGQLQAIIFGNIVAELAPAQRDSVYPLLVLGEQAVAAGDVEQLRSVNQQLIATFGGRDPATSFSTVRR